MEDQYSFRNKLIKITVVVTLLAFLCSMSAMVTYASHKTVIINEIDSVDTDNETQETFSKWVVNKDSLIDDSMDCTVITLPLGNREGAFDYSMRYDLQVFTVSVNNTKENYFLSNPPTGSYEHVESVYGLYDGDNTVIYFELDSVCAAEVSTNNKEITVKFIPISEVSKPIVVIDPGHGGSNNGTRVNDISEKDVVLKIGERVASLCEDKPYTVLLTRSADESMNIEQRISTINVVDGDYYVGLMLSADADDTKLFGMRASYNSEYYHNGLENVNFADELLKSVVEITKNRALSLDDADSEELILKVLDIPATILYLGYLSNAEEISLLGSDNYIDLVAAGIVEGLDRCIIE